MEIGKEEFMGKLELGPMAEEAPVEEAAAEEEEDGPLEDWTRKELVGECKTLGLSDLGVKAVLIARIKEARAATEEEAEVEEAAVEAPPVDESVAEDERGKTKCELCGETLPADPQILQLHTKFYHFQEVIELDQGWHQILNL